MIRYSTVTHVQWTEAVDGNKLVAMKMLLMLAVTAFRPPWAPHARHAHGAETRFGDSGRLGMRASAATMVLADPVLSAQRRPMLAPPVGATYVSTDFLPLVGGLIVKLDITSSTTAQLHLTSDGGKLVLSDTIIYKMDAATGRLDFTLGKRICQLTRVLSIAVLDAAYWGSSDRAFVTIKPLVLPAFRIHLAREVNQRISGRYPADEADAAAIVQEERHDMKAGSGDLPAQRDGLPPVGANYEQSLSLPVIGMQTVRLSIRGEKDARIELAGALTLSEALEYGMDSRGAFTFQLSESTQELLRNMGVALTLAQYEPATDRAAVTIAPPMLGPFRIELLRSTDAR